MSEHISEYISKISLTQIIQIYAILSLCLMPITLIILIYLYKKTNVILNLNEWLDEKIITKTDVNKLLNKEYNQEEKTEKNDEIKEKYNEDSVTVVNDNEMISYVYMHPNDIYKCNTTIYENDLLDNNYRYWSSSSEFVGTINKDGIFKAKHIGKTIIKRGKLAVYKIFVNPYEPKWIAQEEYDNVLQKKLIALTKAFTEYKELTDSYPLINITTYSCKNKHIKKIYYQTDDAGLIQKSLLIIDNNETIKQSILKEMSIRMIKLQTDINKDNGTYWVHLKENGNVDFVAFMKLSVDNVLLLGISTTWRIEGDIKEYNHNAQMIIRTFEKMINPKDYPTIITDIALTDKEERESYNRDENSTYKIIKDLQKENEKIDEQLKIRQIIEDANHDKNLDKNINENTDTNADEINDNKLMEETEEVTEGSEDENYDIDNIPE